jgi:hypothetical protein
MAKQFAYVIIGIPLLVALLAILSQTESETSTTSNTNGVGVTTSASDLGAKGKITQNSPDGKTTTSLEADVSSDGASVRIEQEHRLDFPEELANPLDKVGDTIAQVDETKDRFIEAMKEYTGD